MISTFPGSGDGRETVAIVGTGIAGLVCADRLRERFDITVFEQNDRIGGHTHTVTVDAPDGPWPVDTGFIVYNEFNYPRFTRLLERLGVASRAGTMSFSLRSDRHNVEYNGASLNTVYGQRRNLLRPAFHRMVRDILRYGREATTVLDRDDESMTVETWLRENGYSPWFGELYLEPMGASIWSCPPAAFRSFPIRFVVEFMQHHRMLSVNNRPAWRTIVGGSSTYVQALTAPFVDRIRRATPVRSIRRDQFGVTIETAAGGERFDHVVIACHADQALRLLSDAAPVEREILEAFPFQKNDVILHTDTSILPRRRSLWAGWNYHGDPQGTGAHVTYNMNILQGLEARETYLVTLNDCDAIDPARVVSRHQYDHPLATTARDPARRRHHELIDANRTSFCGAWWGWGFHEDGVASADRVCDQLLQVQAPARGGR